MSEIHNVKLEILRPGPAHNQLLSPLTPYLAICSSGGPVTVRLPFEQRQIIMRLERLRYYSGGIPVPAGQREAELDDLGETIGKMFSQIPVLFAELGSIRAGSGTLVHLRLSLSALELSLVPFETAIAPEGFPGSGSPLLLQSIIPITLTREVRRGKPLPVKWDRPPRILFIFAGPGGLAAVPYEQHLVALRRAIDPWVKIMDNDADRLAEVKKILTVLPDATLEQIRQVCMDTEYTHVHILAHGTPYEHAGDRRYGLALCSGRNPGEIDVVDGERLAIALTMDRAMDTVARQRPTMVSLATCDAGNVRSVLIPGGSIAHELHAAGIPWVFASQFPLWMLSSTIFTESLYKNLLKGADPRCVLHEVRQLLRTACPDTHDWAGIVAYATVPWNFENQVSEFRGKQTRARIETRFARIDDLLKDGKFTGKDKEAVTKEMSELCMVIREELKSWRDDPAVQKIDKEMAERLGVSAASEKRIGIAYELCSLDKKHEKSLDAYRKSCESYKKAIEAEPSNHWVITQYLSMLAVKNRAEDGDMTELVKEYGHWWFTARQISGWHLLTKSGEDLAWACGTLAELEMLGALYGGEDFDRQEAKEEITRYCGQILQICGPQGFPVESTARQFRRYVEIWQHEKWDDLAKTALAAFGGSDVCS